MKICKWLSVVVVWLILSLVQESVVLGDEGSSRVKTNSTPVSIGSECTVSICPSSADKVETFRSIDGPDGTYAYRQKNVDVPLEERNYMTIQRYALAEMTKDIGKGMVSATALNSYMPIIMRELQHNPGYLLDGETNEIREISAFKPHHTVESTDPSVGDAYFEIAPQLSKRRIKEAKLFFRIDPPCNNRTLEIQLFLYKDEETDSNNPVELVDEETMEQPANTTIFVFFNVTETILQRLRNGFYGVRFLVHASGRNHSMLLERWKTEWKCKLPLLQVKEAKRRQPERKAITRLLLRRQ